MAVNSKSSTKKTSKGPAQKKSASKPATAKKPVKATPKPALKPIAKPAAQKPVPAEKKSSAADLAFDKKIDQLAKKGSTEKKSGEGKSSLKTFIGILIIVIIAVVVYLLYPKKANIVKEDAAVQTPPSAPAEVETPEAPQEPVKEAKEETVIQKPSGTVYIVKYKDQLTEISKKHYGNFIGWKRIYEANKDKIKNPRLIFPGQQLIIPDKEK